MDRIKRRMAFILIVTMIFQGVVPVWAEGRKEEKGEACFDESTPSDAERTESGNYADQAAKKDKILPEKDWIIDEDDWFEEESIEEEFGATPGNARERQVSRAELKSSSVGDLWEDWIGNMDFDGEGTRQNPYQINDLADLMGLSEATAAGMCKDDEYFVLTADIDLGDIWINTGNWNPIGWYQNRMELGGEVNHPFRGHFDGGGNTISGLKVISPSQKFTCVGLFGVIDGGSVKNLIVEAETVDGEDNAGVLAGVLKGDAYVYQVTVSGYVNSNGNAGGIAAEVTGSENRVTIENCYADGIVLDSSGANGCTGGIAGNVQNAWLVDNVVITQDGDYDRIKGKGYVGGIAGRMNKTDIYNSYVSGTIGGNQTKAVGGIVGKYCSGNLILARMAGDISVTNNGMASREGTFVGTRESRDTFTYGTEKNNNLSYLFTNDGAKAKRVFGTNLDRDNVFTEKAHIGYWEENETGYVIVTGGTKKENKDRYFYEELEDGVRYIVTQKLDREFTAVDYARNQPFRPDHFAPGYRGKPVRGYLVSIPRIDAKNDKGTYDVDVAELMALPGTNNSYYRAIDKDHAAAVAPGAVVNVVTASKNSGENRYQMAADKSAPGGVKAPVYLEQSGKAISMNYVNGGSYSFVMPECDTELNAEYVKVTTKLTVEPAETSVHVTQVRSGDRKKPQIVTNVTNKEGILIARYIDGSQDISVQVQPIAIHGEHNGNGDGGSRTVLWSVDDTDLLINQSESGYTMKDARIMPNLSSNFIQNIINREVRAQADGQYKEKINNTIYSQYAVVTAATNPASSADNQPVYANCRVKVTFQIVDNTTVRVEGMKLNKDRVSFTITRRLTGDRRKPDESITCSKPVILSAALNPERPFFQNVSWKDRESGKSLTLTPSGKYTQDCQITVKYDPEGKENPAWLQNIILSDEERRRNDPYRRLYGSGSYTETVSAVSEDQTNGHVTAECPVVIRFVTEDETEIYPEEILLSQKELSYDLSYDYTGNIRSAIKSKNGFGIRDTLTADLYPKLAGGEDYQPYDHTVEWMSSDPDALSVEGGRITVADDAEWIQNALKNYPYKAEKTVEIEAKSRTGQKAASCLVRLFFQANVSNRGGSSGGGSSGGGSLGGGSFSGGPGGGQQTGETAAMAESRVPMGAEMPENKIPDYVVYGTWIRDEQGRWSFSDGNRIYADQWAAIYNPYGEKTGAQEGFGWFRFDAEGFMISGWYEDENGSRYYLNPLPDGAMGRMAVGWNWIGEADGREYCYYFHEKSDGNKGKLCRNIETPDGYLVNEKGQWTENGVPKSR